MTLLSGLLCNGPVEVLERWATPAFERESGEAEGIIVREPGRCKLVSSLSDVLLEANVLYVPLRAYPNTQHSGYDLGDKCQWQDT